MNNYDRAVVRAIEKAPAIDPRFPILNLSPSLGNPLRDAPDDEPVYINNLDIRHPNAVYANMDDRAAMWSIFRAISHQRKVPLTVSEQKAQSHITHEDEHFTAARLLGATGARLQVAFSWEVNVVDGTPGLLYWPAIVVDEMRTTKLGHGLAAARPHRLSSGDRYLFTEELGFRDVDELADKARYHNRQSLDSNANFYPIPLLAANPAAR